MTGYQMSMYAIVTLDKWETGRFSIKKLFFEGTERFNKCIKLKGET